MHIRSLAAVGFALAASLGCGDENGLSSLDDFYAPAGSGPSAGDAGAGKNESRSTSCGVSTSGLLAYLPLDGTLELRGSSGFSFDSAPGGPRFVTGRLGQALHGSDQVFVERTGSSVAASAWSVCAWVRMGSANAMGVLVAPPLDFAIAQSGPSAPCPSASAGTFAPFVQTPDTGCFSPANVALSPSAWSFVCLTNDPSQGQYIYVDGTREGREVHAPLVITSGGRIAIGGGPEDDESGIDEVSIWSRALQATEIGFLSGGGNGCAVVSESP